MSAPESAAAEVSASEPPSLGRDPSFWGMTTTQFLGAFNDNLFKQLVLLLCVDAIARGGTDLQFVAMALFAVPFVLFSGFAGWLADRYSKRRIVVLAKVAEIAVMAAGIGAFLIDDSSPSYSTPGSGAPVAADELKGTPLQAGPDWQLAALMVVLAFMATQSAFFGPSKYGILPELFRDRDLPQVNGAVQMTTFVAIIFGMALAGFAKDWFEQRLWMVSLMCVGIAVVGTLTSLIIRRTPIAHRGMPFQPSSLIMHRETRHLLSRDRALLSVLLISSLFWFVGGVVQPAVNNFGKTQMLLGDGRTSLMTACLGVGIAVGCMLAGFVSGGRVSFRMARCGAWGIVLTLAATAWLGAGIHPAESGSPPAPEPFLQLVVPRSVEETVARCLMTVVGFSAGLFVVPLQVFMQSRPPNDQKGRMIGAMNLINWIGIVGSAAFYFAAVAVFDSLNRSGSRVEASWIFAALAVLLLPVALFFHPRDERLG